MDPQDEQQQMNVLNTLGGAVAVKLEFETNV